ncbi:MAG TPA: hypothetical protein VGG38_07970 [Acidimicrobiales bacterium]|jgi:hypothetical protein
MTSSRANLTEVDRPDLPAGRDLAALRWTVHLGLLLTLGGALFVLLEDRQSVALHVILGLAFAGFVVTHLVQRRRTVRRLAGSLVRVRTFYKRRGRMAMADLLLALATIDVVVSGTVDGLSGHQTPLPLSAIGVHTYLGWHTASCLLLLACVVPHVLRRRNRLRSSHVR